MVAKQVVLSFCAGVTDFAYPVNVGLLIGAFALIYNDVAPVYELICALL